MSFVVHLCSDRDVDHQLRPVFSMPVLTRAVASPASFEVLPIFKGEQGIEMSGSPKVEVPAVAAISAAGSSPRDIFLPSEGQTAVPAISCFDLDFCVINEHDYRLTSTGNRKWEEITRIVR